MNRSILLCALLAAIAAASASQLAAQQKSQPADPYQGTSNPPPDDTIVSSAPPVPAPVPAPAPKPSPAQPAYNQPAPPQYQSAPQSAPQSELQAVQQPAPQSSATNESGDGTDDGIVQIAPDSAYEQPQPTLSQRAANDPDGDIVHPAPLPPGELGEGATIRVHLLQRLSTTDSQTGDTFRTRVASDVLQGGMVLIPAGAEIDGRVMSVSSGTLGGHGSMRLSPDLVILPDGSRFHLFAQVTGTPDSNTRVGSEGTINPDSHLKRDGIEYGGAVAAGATTGAILGGPAGALAGTLIGAGAITAHLLINHPQATLDEGTVLLFTLTEPLNLVPAGPAAN